MHTPFGCKVGTGTCSKKPARKGDPETIYRQKTPGLAVSRTRQHQSRTIDTSPYTNPASFQKPRHQSPRRDLHFYPSFRSREPPRECVALRWRTACNRTTCTCHDIARTTPPRPKSHDKPQRKHPPPSGPTTYSSTGDEAREEQGVVVAMLASTGLLARTTKDLFYCAMQGNATSRVTLRGLQQPPNESSS